VRGERTTTNSYRRSTFSHLGVAPGLYGEVKIPAGHVLIQRLGMTQRSHPHRQVRPHVLDQFGPFKPPLLVVDHSHCCGAVDEPEVLVQRLQVRMRIPIDELDLLASGLVGRVTPDLIPAVDTQRLIKDMDPIPTDPTGHSAGQVSQPRTGLRSGQLNRASGSPGSELRSLLRTRYCGSVSNRNADNRARRRSAPDRRVPSCSLQVRPLYDPAPDSHSSLTRIQRYRRRIKTLSDDHDLVLTGR
jgi:hypothetical protein